jgi:Flp pilus assembly protein CpaB
MKTKSIMLIAVSLGFGLIAAIGMSQVLGKKGPEEAKIEMAQVYVAIEPLDIGDELTEEFIAANLRVQKIPASNVPEVAITSTEQLDNMVVTTKVPAGLMLATDFITDKNNARFKKQPPKGMRAYTIKTAIQDTIHNSLQPGDIVDIVGVFRVKSRDGEDRRAPMTFLKNIEVWQTNDVESRGLRDEESGKISTITLLLVPKQIETMALAEDVASLIKVVMSNRDESEPDDDEFDWSKFTNQDSEPQEQPEPPSNQGVTEQFKAAMATTTAISQPSAARVNYTGTMTIYRGGQATKYGFDQDKGLPKVIEQTISAPDTLEQPEPTLTVIDDSADSTNGVDPEGTIEQARDE